MLLHTWRFQLSFIKQFSWLNTFLWAQQETPCSDYSQLKSQPYVNAFSTQLKDRKWLFSPFKHFHYYSMHIQNERIRSATHIFIGSWAQDCFTILLYDSIDVWFYFCELCLLRKPTFRLGITYSGEKYHFNNASAFFWKGKYITLF